MSYFTSKYYILGLAYATFENHCTLLYNRDHVQNLISTPAQAKPFSQYLPKPRTSDKGKSRCAEREICGETTFDDSSLPDDLQLIRMFSRHIWITQPIANCLRKKCKNVFTLYCNLLYIIPRDDSLIIPTTINNCNGRSDPDEKYRKIQSQLTVHTETIVVIGWYIL